MSESTIDVGSEHVCHGTDGGLLQLGDMSLERVGVYGTEDCPVNMVQGVDEVHELCEISSGKEQTYM